MKKRILLAATAIILCIALSTATSWWDTGWQYRKEITLTESAGIERENEPISIEFSLNGKSQDDCDDVRIIDGTGAEITSAVSGCDSGSGTVWFQVDASARTSESLYLYYGNSSANAPSYSSSLTVTTVEADSEYKVEAEGWETVLFKGAEGSYHRPGMTSIKISSSTISWTKHGNYDGGGYYASAGTTLEHPANWVCHDLNAIAQSLEKLEENPVFTKFHLWKTDSESTLHWYITIYAKGGYTDHYHAVDNCGSAVSVGGGSLTLNPSVMTGYGKNPDSSRLYAYAKNTGSNLMSIAMARLGEGGVSRATPDSDDRLETGIYYVKIGKVLRYYFGPVVDPDNEWSKFNTPLSVFVGSEEEVPPQKCSDGTLVGACSQTKPKYCETGTLINKPSQCGCQEGYADCDSEDSNGCETNTDTDKSNCGSCENICTASHATTTCSSGACAIHSCDADYADCNSQYDDGCETETRINDENCGSCGNSCAGNQACESGSCVTQATPTPYPPTPTLLPPTTTPTTTPTPSPITTATLTPVPSITSIPACSDGTQNEECSTTKPKYCDSGTLIDKPSECRCPTGKGDCDDSNSNGCESNLDTDKDNCGTCDKSCDDSNKCTTDICQFGACASLELTDGSTSGGWCCSGTFTSGGNCCTDNDCGTGEYCSKNICTSGCTTDTECKAKPFGDCTIASCAQNECSYTRNCDKCNPGADGWCKYCLSENECCEESDCQKGYSCKENYCIPNPTATPQPAKVTLMPSEKPKPTQAATPTKAPTETPVDRCNDGTPKNECSKIKPYYCNANLQLVDGCGACGCPKGKECNNNGKCIAQVQEATPEPTVMPTLEATPKPKDAEKVESAILDANKIIEKAIKEGAGTEKAREFLKQAELAQAEHRYLEAYELTVKAKDAIKPVKKDNGQNCETQENCISANCRNGICCVQGNICCKDDSHCAEDHWCDTYRHYCQRIDPMENIARILEQYQVIIGLCIGLVTLLGLWMKRRPEPPKKKSLIRDGEVD